MALGQGTTQLSDVYTPEVVNPLLFREAIAQAKVLRSDAVALSPTMTGDMTGNGFLFTAPQMLNIADSTVPALVPNDDPNHIGIPEKIASFLSYYLRLARNNGWAAMDVIFDQTGEDPIAQVARQYGAKIAKNRETTLMNVLKGLMNATVAGTTLFKTIAAEATGSVTASTKFNPESLIDLFVATMGDNYDPSRLTLITSPATYGQMLKDDLIDGEKISTQGLTIPTYMGISVVTSRVAPSRAGTTSGTAYTSYLVRDGAIQMGIGRAKVPTEIERKPSIGNSGAGEIFWARDVFGYAVDGFSYTGGTNAASPVITDAQLAVAGNWTRVLEPEQVGIMALEHN